ncbi:MAG TPA: NAD(P)/FAD-dependent oxidoreductase, partial [Thermoanaerobaculia bacterium]
MASETTATTGHDLLVIGAGPAGYVGAIRAAQLGLGVGLVEKETLAGGTCLRIGCIPSKALLESTELWQRIRGNLIEHGIHVGTPRFDLAEMLGRQRRIVDTLGKGVAGLLEKNRVTRYTGTARLTAAGRVALDSGEEIEAGIILIATGSDPVSLPGIVIDHDRIGDSTDALEYDEVPRRLVVIGAGVIGLELGSVWSRLGSEVTVLEYLDRILPGTDAEIAAKARELFEAQGIRFRLGARVTGVATSAGAAEVQVDGSEPIRADKVLVAVGRRPRTAGLGLDALGVELDRHGAIVVDAAFQSTRPGIYAVGDVIPGPMLAHKAEEEA